MSSGTFSQVFRAARRWSHWRESWQHLVGELSGADMVVGVSDLQSQEKNLFLCSWQQQFPLGGKWWIHSIPFDGNFCCGANGAGILFFFLKGPNNYCKHTQMMPPVKSQKHETSSWMTRLMSDQCTGWIETYRPNQFLLWLIVYDLRLKYIFNQNNMWRVIVLD